MSMLAVLPGKCTPTATSLLIPENTTEKEWAALGERIGLIESGVQWWVGDWWAFGEAKYGERKALVESEDWKGPGFGACRNAAVVCRAFETSRRRDVLSFYHHAEVAALPPAQADALLDEAERGTGEGDKWKPLPIRYLRTAVNRLKNAARIGATNESEGGRVEDLHSMIAAGEKFGAIYADPPWLYDNQSTRAATGNHYKGLTVDELCALPIRDLAADNAHLHLWTTNGFLFECPRIIEAWGFEFRSSFVWVKPQMGIGNYWRNSHEILLTSIRGDAKRFNDKSLMSWLECERGLHSAKPEQVRHYIERASPGPFLELFARSESTNWKVWGNQVSDTLFDKQEAA